MNEFEQILANEIRSDETILWQDQPIAKLVAKPVILHRVRKIYIGFILSAFSLLLVYSLSILGFYHSKLLFIITGILIIKIIIVFWGFWRIYEQCTQLHYIITNTRVLIIQLGKKVAVASYLKENILQNGYTKSYNADGSGTIIFDSTKAQALRGLKDVKQVAAILDNWPTHPPIS